MNKAIEAAKIKAKELRFKRPALEDMDYNSLVSSLQEIQDDCIDIQYTVADDDKLIAALDGDDEEAYEFKMAFAELENNAFKLAEAIENPVFEEAEEEYNDCTVSLVGDIYNLIGYDVYEKDYYKLTSYESEYATTEAGKRLMRKTKADMLNTIGFNLRIFLNFYEIKQRYELLKATIDIIKGKDQSIIDQMREIDKAYELADNASDGFKYSGCKEVNTFNKLLELLPEQLWVE